MKRYTLICVLLILVLFGTSCSVGNTLPDTVTLDEEEYKLAFTAELYPTVDRFALEEKVSGVYYKEYLRAPYDCYIAYGHDAEPNVYFASKEYEEAVSYFENADNFNFFCIKGNVFDASKEDILQISDINSEMFDKLTKFFRDNDYNPLTSFNNEEGLKTVLIPDPNNWTDLEIHFYKESKDGAFITSRGNTLVMYENKLHLLYVYDFANENAPKMRIKALPTEINDYFCSLLNSLWRF